MLLVPLVGLLAGMMLWSRLTHLLVAAFGLRSSPSRAPMDWQTAEKKGRRLVWSLLVGWLVVFGLLIGIELRIDQVGWAVFFAGMLAVPLFLAPIIFKTLRKMSDRLRSSPAP